MSFTATLDFSFKAPTGPLGGGLTVQPSQYSFTASAAERLSFTAPSGDANLVLHSNANYLVLFPPAGNTVLWKTKGAAGDTGIVHHLTLPTIVSVTYASNSIVILNCANTIAGFEAAVF